MESLYGCNALFLAANLLRPFVYDQSHRRLVAHSWDRVEADAAGVTGATVLAEGESEGPPGFDQYHV